MMNIKVDHFSLNFKSFVLKSKINEFNEMLNDAKDDEGNEITVGGHPFDDLALSELLNKIVDKYDYAVDEYLAIKYMIDSQFEITYTFVKR